MTFIKGHHPGAVWRKADLQCHSPRDQGWTQPPSLPGGTPEFEKARDDWAALFIAECRTRNLELVSITDHHDMTFVPYVVKAAAGDKFTLVMPGVEVTCNDNTQCLVLFDPACPPEIWTHFLGKLKGVTQSPANESKAAKAVNAGISISDLFEDVTSDKALRDVCIMLPHFSDPSAHKSLNEPGHHDRFATIQCDGVYIEKPFSDLERGTQDKAYGKVSDWGTRRRAIIATGDNKMPTWDRLGTHECWIKLGDETIEALRQALLADEARISHATPVIPSERIVELRVLSTLTGEELFTMSFNDGFNVIIGGRGSGKSALLEYLRFGLGRTLKDLPRREIDVFDTSFDREAQLIDDTLGDDGYVEVIIEREGVRETWLRTSKDRDVITVTNEDDSETEFSIEDAQQRFPARAFSQKGLSTTMNDSANAAEQVTGIAAAEQLDKRRDIDTSIERVKRQIGTTLRKQTAYWEIQLERRRAQTRIADLKRRIAAIAARLEKEGVSRETLDVIAKKAVYDRTKNYQGQVNRARNTDRDRLTALRENFLNIKIASFQGAEDFPEIAALDAAVAAARDNVLRHVQAALDDMRVLGQAYVDSLAAFTSREDQFRIQLDAAVQAQSAHKQLLEDSAKLSAELKEAEAEELEIGEQEEATKDAPKNFADSCAELDKLLTERTRVLTEAAMKVEGQSGKMLKASHRRDPRPREYVDALMKVMASARVHDVESKCEDWIRELAKHDANPTWAVVRASLLVLFKAKVMAGSPTEPSDDHAKKLKDLIFSQSNLTDQQTHRVYQNLDDDRLSDIFAAVPRDFIVMNYVDQGRAVEFEKASPGQQASALLELLLNQSAGTLIIDQPEDDLDNRVIMQIVNLIRKSKDRRQLLFTTHNPNIVVNGDADKVVALKSGDTAQTDGRIQIDVDGAIETPEIRKVITHIMEGGKAAFDLRNRKYNFETIAD
ncbi:TrlF family AAA-like ATPase [Bradyrhizobium sp. BRP56]|uniref:TrlF family AAA-like ATPase n=1 Tax=Bradyrhizobium sp. BRP56 TaxID=2793819 RepID=UPI001CD41679|nr:AAA family ATPase [Bradyrhizobium sp. BRP56]MCA1402552.1 AAA family ATPase [Bradyrhizobium sp. BRP56]